MDTFNDIWSKLADSKEYREEFVGSLLKRGTALQIQGLLDGLSQKQFADQAGLTQGVISRAVDPDYGNLTFNTVIKIAAGADVAFIGKFVPFSELAKWVESIPEGGVSFKIPNFEEENKHLAEVKDELTAASIKKPPTKAEPSKVLPFPIGQRIVQHQRIVQQQFGYDANTQNDDIQTNGYGDRLKSHGIELLRIKSHGGRQEPEIRRLEDRGRLA
jgi:hypothetical protein